MNKFMKIAIEEALAGMENNDGGPFGAVIVRNGEIISSAHNQVIKTNDPTAHAEVTAIRKASSALGKFDLSDCIIYSSCEPCPMCFAAIHWAKIKTLYYGSTRQDASNIDFDDQYIYDVINGTAKKLQVERLQIDREESLEAFKKWKIKIDRVQY
ncbi:nucleoside deaminase [Clostridium sp. CM028]|uniref:nucleoside deaminase n=1 Tax=Clostridium sp. CM028 TaxID=2851575 RepID=UPI001C6DEAF9|nr:nucleoside deaminase [Clostridium sp. CM028]MBW9149837.1 nucleoside deaminase [Clostridium sp. CM028]WLC63173.1 nucleoside deaminase [Clostridium sp. CM028]